MKTHTKEVELKEYQIYRFLSEIDVAPEIIDANFDFDSNIEKNYEELKTYTVKLGSGREVERHKSILKTYNYIGLLISLTSKKYNVYWNVKDLSEYKKDINLYKEQFLELLDTMHKSGIYHYDIYEENYVFDIEIKKAYFIDCGLSGYFGDLPKFSE